MTIMPNRRWLSFSLRTLFVLVTLIMLLTCWFSYHVRWIYQRRAVVQDPRVQSARYFNGISFDSRTGASITRRVYFTAPWPLSWMGEPGYWGFHFEKGTPSNEMARVGRLFPEAEFIEAKED